MPFKGPVRDSRDTAPRRAPPRSTPVPEFAPEPDSHEFPSSYDWSAAMPPPPPKTLDPALERLVEMACAALGCPREEASAMKQWALERPDAVGDFCRRVHEASPSGPPAPDPLAEARADGSCAFWLDGLHGKAIATLPMSPEVSAYDGQLLVLHDAPRTPFPLHDPDLFEQVRAKRCGVPTRSLGSGAESSATPSAGGQANAPSGPWAQGDKDCAVDRRRGSTANTGDGLSTEEDFWGIAAPQALPGTPPKSSGNGI